MLVTVWWRETSTQTVSNIRHKHRGISEKVIFWYVQMICHSSITAPFFGSILDEKVKSVKVTCWMFSARKIWNFYWSTIRKVSRYFFSNHKTDRVLTCFLKSIKLKEITPSTVQTPLSFSGKSFSADAQRILGCQTNFKFQNACLSPCWN